MEGGDRRWCFGMRRVYCSKVLVEVRGWSMGKGIGYSFMMG